VPIGTTIWGEHAFGGPLADNRRHCRAKKKKKKNEKYEKEILFWFFIATSE
jgi:hypothetical protein